ncbi:MAG: hypothetical protein GY859_41170 [Desulfobacterales bacterium]|nr:hypothetical protein [Desulfobacterales bacterium]
MGACFAAAGAWAGALNPMQAGAVFVVGAVSGLLPDLDSDTGKPLSFLFHLVSVLAPSLFLGKIVQLQGWSLELIICYFTASYLIINHVILGVVKKITRHRGMMHSVPFCLLSGGVTYLLFLHSGRAAAVFAGVSVFFGCMGHLVLDEFSSFHFKYGLFPAAKRSRGTALKYSSKSRLSTGLFYFLLFFVGLAIFIPIFKEGA